MNKKKSMSDAEKEIMAIIWEYSDGIFISDLLELVEQQNKNWKRTTIRTFVTRLMEKGLIKTERYGKMCKYIAAVSEEDYLEQQAKTFVEEVFHGNVKNLLTSLFGPNSLKQENIEHLEDFWNKGKEDIK